MDTGFLTPLLDMFKHGHADHETRLVAAQGELELRPEEQRGLLAFLSQDRDADVASAAAASLAALTAAPAAPPAAEADAVDDPVDDPVAVTPEVKAAKEKGTLEKLAAMNPAQRLGRAMKGTREERAILIRDPNKIVSTAVLSSPKLSEAEVESIAKMANVSDEILRIIGNTRAWVKNYRVVAALTRNPKTPLGVSLTLLSRLNEKDTKLLITDRNVPDPLRIAARRKLSPKG